MGKQFQKIILMGTLPFLLGLGACALNQDDSFYFEEEESETQTPELTNIIVDDSNVDILAPCISEDEDCEVSDGYLTQNFSQTGTIRDGLALADEEPISLSRPGGKNALSVKDKQSLKKTSSKTEENVTVTVSETPLPVSKTEQTKTEKGNEEADKVLYTTVAIPEELGTTKTTETTLTTTKIIKTPPAETTPEEIPSGMMPLKKTVTTITETTTKVKQEKEAPTDFKKMTLDDRIAYGESVQEWEALTGKTLRGLLQDWGTKSGWTVVWKLDRDYHLEAGVVFKGTFVDVSGALIRSFARATPAPIGTFHQGNRVLVISTQEDENER